MTTSSFLLYLATWSLVAISPGPAAMCAMTFASRFGMRAAMIGIAGIQLGHFIFFGCIAAGLAALLTTATTVFMVLRGFGALYLLYLGIRIIHASFRATVQAEHSQSSPVPRSLLLQGFAIQVTNPKALLFMSALLPQFIRPESALTPQLLILLATTIIVDVIVLGGYALLAHRGTGHLRASGILPWLERAFGAVLVFFGVRILATTK